MVRETVRRVGIDTFFGIIVTSAQLGVRKPRPEPFLEALTALNSAPMEGVMVGDTISTDIRGARALSMKAIHINRRRDEWEDVRPDVEVDSLNDACSIIEEWRV